MNGGDGGGDCYHNCGGDDDVGSAHGDSGRCGSKALSSIGVFRK